MSGKLQKIDKRQLYFDRNRKIFIEFDLEKTRTCLEIKEALNEEIEKRITEIYKNNNNKFCFIMVYSRSKNDNSSLIEMKLDLNTQLSDIMVNKQYYLCYLPISNTNINQKRKVRNKFEDDHIKNERFKDVERDSLSTHEIEKYLLNEGVYYFDKEKAEFIYGKGYVDENKIIINYKKSIVEISISEIKKEDFYENKVPTSIEILKIKCPNYIFEIHQNNVLHFLGLYKLKSYLLWKNCIDSAKIKNNNSSVDLTFNTNILNYNYLLFVKRHSIPSKCYIINQILENPEKRQIFFDGYHDKKISDLTISIFSYKINLKNNKYVEAWICLKQISFYIDYNNIKDEIQKNREKEKYAKIFTQERIDFYNSVVKDVNEAITKIKNYKEEINIVLKNIFKIDLFDSLYYNIYEYYIYPYFLKIKAMLNTEYEYDQKPDIIQKYHLLLSKYYVNFFNMKNLDNFNCLCIKKYEKEDSNNYSNSNIINNTGETKIESNESSNNDNSKNVDDNKGNKTDNNNSSNDDGQTEQHTEKKNDDNLNST
jgi:hypothetical protein